MYWQDILVDRDLADGEIQSSFSRSFDTPAERISVVSSIEEAPSWENLDILCVRSRMAGDFPLRLSISLLDTLDRGALWVLGRFCEDLKCSCIISDDSLDPYRMIAVTGMGRFFIVHVDVELLDEFQRCVITGVVDDLSSSLSPLTNLQRRILENLEEAGEEDISALTNTAVENRRGSSSEIDDLGVELASLVSRGLVEIARDRDPISRRWSPLDRKDALELLLDLRPYFIWSEVGLWTWLKNLPRLQVLATEPGLVVARRILSEED